MVLIVRTADARRQQSRGVVYPLEGIRELFGCWVGMFVFVSLGLAFVVPLFVFVVCVGINPCFRAASYAMIIAFCLASSAAAAFAAV